jgi:transcriptional regulator with XRE-family HTH domain
MLMTGRQLVQFRKQNKRTQVQAARALGVSQTYLSLLENGKRPLSAKLEAKAVRVFGLPPTEMPVKTELSKVPTVTDDQLATDLATLGYGGFSYLKKSHPKNPATVLFSALNSPKREARLVEALP